MNEHAATKEGMTKEFDSVTDEYDRRNKRLQEEYAAIEKHLKSKDFIIAEQRENLMIINRKINSLEDHLQTAHKNMATLACVICHIDGDISDYNYDDVPMLIRCPSKHATCSNCIAKMLTAANGIAVKCIVCPAPGCGYEYEDTALATTCPESFAKYKSAKDVMAAQTEFAADRQLRVNAEGEKAVLLFDLEETSFVLTPCCSMRVNSFKNCCTMKCECGINFCAWCFLKGERGDDFHWHQRVCEVNPSSGAQYANTVKLRIALQNCWRVRQLQQLVTLNKLPIQMVEPQAGEALPVYA